MTTRYDGRDPQPARRDTAPIEQVGHPVTTAPLADIRPEREGRRDRLRRGTAELIPPEDARPRIAAPLGLDDDDLADIERTLGFESTPLFDDAARDALRAQAERVTVEDMDPGVLFGSLDGDPMTTADYAADVALRYRDLPSGGAESTVDFADSLDTSLDQAIDAAPLAENPTDIEAPRPDTRPLGRMTTAEWAAHVLTACRTLAELHAAGRTFGGRFDMTEDGVVGEAGPVLPGGGGQALDVRRMRHLVGVIAEAVRAGGDHSPTSVVVADALSALGPAETAEALARALHRALESRTTRQRKRLAAEFEAVEARRRALSTQRRLRADLAARLARLDASISAQAAAVARDEDRVQMLTAEQRALDGLGELVGVEDGEAAPTTGEAQRPPVDESSLDDAVRRLLGA